MLLFFFFCYRQHCFSLNNLFVSFSGKRETDPGDGVPGMCDPGSPDGSDREMKQFTTFKPARGVAITNPLYGSVGGPGVIDGTQESTNPLYGSVGGPGGIDGTQESTNPLYESADNMTGKLPSST